MEWSQRSVGRDPSDVFLVRRGPAGARAAGEEGRQAVPWAQPQDGPGIVPTSPASPRLPPVLNPGKPAVGEELQRTQERPLEAYAQQRARGIDLIDKFGQLQYFVRAGRSCPWGPHTACWSVCARELSDTKLPNKRRQEKEAKCFFPQPVRGQHLPSPAGFVIVMGTVATNHL